VRGRARLFVEIEKGAGPARNRGVAEARGGVLAFLDADCVASPRWLEEGLHGLERFDVVGGRVDVSVADERRMSGAEAFERVFAFDFRSYIEDKGFTGSGNLFCRREVFETVGGFRAAVSEDMDWSHRATALGYALGYHEAAAIAHPARADWSELTRKWSRLNRESLRLSEGRRFGRLRWLARNWLVPASIVPHAARVMTSRKLPDLRSRLRALGTLAGIRLWRFADAHRALLERATR
jgi:GT2 family glycosyltransferase